MLVALTYTLNQIHYMFSLLIKPYHLLIKIFNIAYLIL